MSHLPEALAQAGKPATAAAAAAAAASAAAVLPRMSEYFGCVTSVPQLSPGEVRAAGVTAHPNVVATFVRQRDAATMQALQPWSVVVPPASQQQLAACGVQPSSIATQLRTLLHASNVLNNHLIDATSAPSGSAAAALLQDQQSAGAGLSGGYAGMPQDLPVRYVRGGFVGADDPRRLLQGEFTLTALQDLEPGTVLGPWRSYALTQQDYAVLMNSPPAGWQAPPGITRDTAWLELLHKYTLTLHVPVLEGADPAGTACSHTAHTLYFCALGHGNLTCLANDPLIDPLSAAAASISSGAASLTAAAASASSAWDAAHHPRIGPPNVRVVVVLVNGLPLPLLVTTRQLQAGDQVCYSYGAAYWHAWAGIRAHILKEQHGAAAGAGAAAAAHGAKGGRQTQGLML
ncbi:hypothetical protein COO60DRAFT_1509388 [Scenedesmus sp. NREL 46B-D3]|nr:hypothetical protein COO60DRAFT_1509388 [Scenedesmus sp. NREL 46B-D3]